MYFHRKKSGTGGLTLQLLASHRPAGALSPRHHVVASLGGMEMPEDWDVRVATLVESKLRGKLHFESNGLPAEALAMVDRIVSKIESEGSWPPPPSAAALRRHCRKTAVATTPAEGAEAASPSYSSEAPAPPVRPAAMSDGLPLLEWDVPVGAPHDSSIELTPVISPSSVPVSAPVSAPVFTPNSASGCHASICPSAGSAPSAGWVAPVVIDRVTHGRNGTVGAYLPGLHAWKELGMPALLRRLGFSSTHAAVAEALVLGRMAAPMSEHAFHRHIPLTALPDILGDRLLNISLDTFYRVGDRLLAAKGNIERHLRETTELKLGLSRSILLYDLTNFHFEGVCERNPKAVRGKNKQKRDDCPQVIAGVVFDEYGFELLHKTFPGNKSDSKSLPDIIGALDAATRSSDDLQFNRPTVIMDAGISSEENVKSIIEKQLHYIVHDRRPLRVNYADLFAEGGFEEIPGRPPDEAVMVRLVDVPKDERSHPEVSEKLLLCKSGGRQAKEKAITSKAEERILKDLEKLLKRVEKGRIKDRPTLDQAVGRLNERHSRVARFYKIEADGPYAPKTDALNPNTSAEAPKELATQKLDDAKIDAPKIDAPKTDTPKPDDAKADGKPKLKISWSRISDKFEAEAALQGCYVLRTDRDDLNAHKLWKLYTTLSKAEDGFRSLKGECGLRPNFHQTEDRVDSHVFQTILAYQMVRFALYKLEAAGDDRLWTTIRRILSTHCYATVHLPLEDGSCVHVRRPGEPEECQRDIYRKLGIYSMDSLPIRKNQTPPPQKSKL